MAMAGWYRDKNDPSRLRYWDGAQWTGDVRYEEPAVPDAAPALDWSAVSDDASSRVAEPAVEPDPVEPVEIPATAKSGLGKKDIKYILLGLLAGTVVGLPAAYFVYGHFAGT